MPDTQTTRKPRLSKRAPVTVLHLCADNDRNGDPRRCFAVLERATGYHVETIDEGYEGEGALYKRYPWFHHSVAHRHGLTPAYATRVNTTPAEYRRWLRRFDADVSSVARIRRTADSYEARFDSLGHAR